MCDVRRNAISIKARAGDVTIIGSCELHASCTHIQKLPTALLFIVHSSSATMAAPGVDDLEIQQLFTNENVLIYDLEDEDHTVCFEYTVAEALKAENVLVRRLTLTGSWPDHLSQRAALALLDAFRHNATIDELILMF
jgi:hypothetical protein